MRLTLLNIHLQEFPLQTQNLWEESIKINHAMRFTNVCAHQITGICAQKKHVLKQAVICYALGRCAGHYENDLAESVFFNVRIVSKSHAEFSLPIGTFMELCSNTNLPFSKSGPWNSIVHLVKVGILWLTKLHFSCLI